MAEREKVINGLKTCAGTNNSGDDDTDDCVLDCPYKGSLCIDRLMYDAIDLLKEQEAKLVEIDGQLGGIKYGRCPKCGKGLNEEVYPHWCGFCGQAVKWND